MLRRRLIAGPRTSGYPPRARSGWASLTPIELQVASLAVEGLTNPEIGARLFTSRNTFPGATPALLTRELIDFVTAGLKPCWARWEGDVMLDGFTTAEVPTGETTILVRSSGSGPALLLLHGFPETHLMWRGVAPVLAERFTVVCADLRGYGGSGCPPSTPEHTPYAKRAMAQDMVAVMEALGHPRFSVAGHDRGGRVGYRMALDHPGRVDRLAVLDVVPTDTVWDRADARLALAFWPWSLLAQPEPLPERILTASAGAIVDDALGAWGSPGAAFPAQARAAYAEALADPAHAHAICEEYRAAATIDRDHDAADRAAGRRIACPVMALWSAGGPLDTWYADDGGPLALWRSWADDLRGSAVTGGHFFPEAAPGETADALGGFLAGNI